MEEDLLALLLASSGVTALVGDRIDWGAIPQGRPWPCVALHLISDPGDHTLDGPTGMMAARVQVDAWALTIGEAVVLGRAVRDALDGYRDDKFGSVLRVNRRTDRDGSHADRPFRDSTDFIVHYHNH